jgi:AcrR family transcriptional regulator
MELRTRIIEAAAKVYAEVGYRGATTRRIAGEAGCNELTLFRHFGSKSALIHEAVTCCGPTSTLIPLPEVPVEPWAEVRHWAGLHFAQLRQHQSLIRTTIGELEEHPELVRPSDSYCLAYDQLGAYVAKLQATGRAHADVDPMCAAAMLLNTVMMNAIMRDIMADLIPDEPELQIDQFVRNFLRGIGAPLPSHA